MNYEEEIKRSHERRERIAKRSFPNGAIAKCYNPLCDEEKLLSFEDVVKCLGSGWPRCHEERMNVEPRGPLL